tara:strand:- start:1463 stop:1924 length:462 start_codon:yes stop_codon:yes gene_type:complete
MSDKHHWIIRVGDGINFKNSKYPFWGMKKGSGGGIKTLASKIKRGDILWFVTNKKHGGYIIGMAEFINMFDKDDEPLVEINTQSNLKQNWVGNDNWKLQVNYKNLYNTEKQKIQCIIQCAAIILNYERFKEKITANLYEHYKNYIYYAEPIKI